MKIAEVSERFGLSADTLRYYERIGLISSVRRDKSGIRDYDEPDLARIEFLKCMRSAGLPIEALIEYVALYERGDHTVGARRDILIEQRALLVERMDVMQKTLDLLNYKIDLYAARVAQKNAAGLAPDAEAADRPGVRVSVTRPG